MLYLCYMCVLMRKDYVITQEKMYNLHVYKI